jgi:hypothetical protein
VATTAALGVLAGGQITDVFFLRIGLLCFAHIIPAFVPRPRSGVEPLRFGGAAY